MACGARAIDSQTSHGISRPGPSSANSLARRVVVRGGFAGLGDRRPSSGRQDARRYFMTSRAHHDRMANAIRALAMDAVEQAKSGHPGLPMGAADIATVLFTRFLKFDPADPKWPDRDRFVLSAGHG